MQQVQNGYCFILVGGRGGGLLWIRVGSKERSTQAYGSEFAGASLHEPTLWDQALEGG